MRRATVVRRGLLLSVGLVLAAMSTEAAAGRYQVVGGCGNWSSWNSAPSRIAIYPSCPNLLMRNVGGPFSTGVSAEGQWFFRAPGGALIYNVTLSAALSGRRGWQAAILTDTGLYLANCPGPTCPGGQTTVSFTSGWLNAPTLVLRLRCSATGGCPNTESFLGMIETRQLVVTVADGTRPSVTITGGSLLSGWARGRATVTASASDNVGIKQDRLLIDGAAREQRARACRWGARIPCPNGAAILTLDTTRLADGPHALAVQAVDSADNTGGVGRTVYVDNTPPAAPTQLRPAAGSSWQAANEFDLSWANPVQSHAPVTYARYELCPTSATAQRSECVTDYRLGVDIQSIADLRVPKPGAWRLRLWVGDAAGNEDQRAHAETVLRFDDRPPAVVFREQVASDPARLHVAAADTHSAVARVEVEVRRRNSPRWLELAAARAGANTFTAFMDDETLPAGHYELRARAIDMAGNERTTSGRENGHPAVMRLPVRARSSLRVGKASKRCTRPRGHCRTRFSRSISVPFGGRPLISGRLATVGRPLAGAGVVIWSRLASSAARWTRTGVVSTTKRGRIRYRVPRGPARVLRFRYPGAAAVRGATRRVEVNVRAATTLDVSRRSVVNGEYVTFQGRVRGRYLPAGGKLVELQVYTRRRWRTFAQPRASAASGRWRFQYRFEAVSGRALFRFRARVRREDSFPYATGTSRRVRVMVHGI